MDVNKYIVNVFVTWSESLKSYRDGCELGRQFNPTATITSLKSYRDGCEHEADMRGEFDLSEFKIIQRWMWTGYGAYG